MVAMATETAWVAVVVVVDVAVVAIVAVVVVVDVAVVAIVARVAVVVVVVDAFRLLIVSILNTPHNNLFPITPHKRPPKPPTTPKAP